MQSPYQTEQHRNELATLGKLQELKKTYTSKYPEIRDENSARFWNHRLANHEELHQQDGMTQDRIKIAARFLPQYADRVLDIGIGHGWVEELIVKRNIEIYGNDISDQTIKNLKNRFQGFFSVQSLYKLHYKKQFFDAIFLLEVLEHVPPSKTLRVLKKIRNLLKPHGCLILSVPTNEGLDVMPDNPNGHVRMYTIPLIRAELELCGFKVINLKTLYAFRRNYTLKKLLAYIWRNRWRPNNIVVLAQKIDSS